MIVPGAAGTTVTTTGTEINWITFAGTNAWDEPPSSYVSYCNVYKSGGAAGLCKCQLHDLTAGTTICETTTTASSDPETTLECASVTNVPTAVSQLALVLVPTSTAECKSRAGVEVFCDWGATDNYGDVEVTFLAGSGNTIWTNMPSGGPTEYLEATFRKAAPNLIYTRQVRLYTNIIDAGHTGASLAVQYSLDCSTSWTYLDGVSGPSVTIDATGLRRSSWVNLDAAAQIDLTTGCLRLVGNDGNDAADPNFSLTALVGR